MRAFTFCFIFVAFFLPKLVLADDSELLIAAIDWSPYTIHKGGGTEGVAIEMLQEVARRENLTLKIVQIPISRIDEMLEKRAAIVPLLAKSPKRDGQVNYIGKTADDWYCFLTLKKNPPVKTLEQAKDLKSLAAARGAISDNFLKTQGFTNLDYNDGGAGGIRKVVAEVADAAFLPYRSVVYTIKAQGMKADDVECTGKFMPVEYYIGASKQLAAPVFEKLRKSYAELEKEGYLKKTWKGYQ